MAEMGLGRIIRVGHPVSACPFVLQLQTYRIIAMMRAKGQLRKSSRRRDQAVLVPGAWPATRHWALANVNSDPYKPVIS
jgi:hypothetical protein